VSRLHINGEHSSLRDIPLTMKAAAFDVLTEASAAREDLRDVAASMANEARLGAKLVRKHGRRAAGIGGNAAADMIEAGREAGTQAWRDARRQAAEWGTVALRQARSRPAVVLVGVAVVGVALGFWLRGASRRAAVQMPRRTTRTSKAGTAKSDAS
jgi:hypothetical protein